MVASKPLRRDGAGLSTLKEKKVGAIYLGSAETPFSVPDQEKQRLSPIRASRGYSSEDGRTGAFLFELDDDLINRQAFTGFSDDSLHLAVLFGLECVFHLHCFDYREFFSGAYRLAGMHCNLA